MRTETHSSRLITRLTIFILLLHASPCFAFLAPILLDSGLAQAPLIVIAHWDRSPVVTHKHPPGRGGSPAWQESRTGFVIDRVVKGDIRPGHYTVLGALPAWQEHRTELQRQTLAVFGPWVGSAVTSLTEPNLWFLSRKHSRERGDPTFYLSLDCSVSIQPLELEDYFEALISPDPAPAMKGLLATSNPRLLDRVRAYLVGETYPNNPFEDHFTTTTRTHPPLYALADAVLPLLEKGDEWQRDHAATIYGILAGRGGIPRMRSLLSSPEERLRVTAIEFLAHWRDDASAKEICTTAQGLRDPGEAFAVIESLSEWNNPQTIPAIISYLDIPTTGFPWGENYGPPALHAADALEKMTGYRFPFNVKASLVAWDQARRITDRKEQVAFLTRVLANDPRPLSARIRCSETDVWIGIQNTSNLPVTVEKEPEITVSWSDEHSGGGNLSRSPTYRDPGFITLQGGQEIQIPTAIPSGELAEILRPDHLDVTITLAYGRSGSAYGPNPWIGSIKVETGAGLQLVRKKGTVRIKAAPPESRATPAGLARAIEEGEMVPGGSTAPASAGPGEQTGQRVVSGNFHSPTLPGSRDGVYHHHGLAAVPRRSHQSTRLE